MSIFFQIMTYTRGTKALIRQATASDFFEHSSVSNMEPSSQPQPQPQAAASDKKVAKNREAERRVSCCPLHFKLRKCIHKLKND